MEIYAKAALTMEQISVKQRIGCDGIEVQLLNELRGQQGYQDIEETFDLGILKKAPIRVIHAPIFSGVGDMTIEQMCDTTDEKLFYEVCRLASIAGRCSNTIITIVVHSETYLDFVAGLGDTYARIRDHIRTALSRYDNIRFGIENVSPLRGIGKGSSLHLSNNFKFDNVEMCNKLREDIGSDRIGTVLDTCHAMLANKYITALYREVGDRPYEDLSMNAYFEANKDVAFLIHLCDISGSGYGKGRHGVPFTYATLDKCAGIINLYYKYGYTCPVTLEVEESDFSICDGYAKTLDVVKHILKSRSSSSLRDTIKSAEG